MRGILALILLVLIGFGIYWFVTEGRRSPRLDETREEIATGAERARRGVSERLEDLSLRTEDIREEITRTGRVVRQRSREIGGSIAEATADARITTAIKTRLATDPDLSAIRISVNTTDGIVTLSGSVESHDHIGKAMLLALETEGVREVVSTLQVRQTRDLLP
jgi:hyperosmotically inducible periplasmic protein